MILPVCYPSWWTSIVTRCLASLVRVVSVVNASGDELYALTKPYVPELLPGYIPLSRSKHVDSK
jgi:hypothetical protein